MEETDAEECTQDVTEHMNHQGGISANALTQNYMADETQIGANHSYRVIHEDQDE